MADIERNQIGQSKSSLEAAAEAAAKVNAMLIAKGKLKPSELVQPVVYAKAKPVPENTGINVGSIQNPGSLVVAEVVINDVPAHCRNMLTKGTAQEEISKLSGAAVSTRGRYMSPDDKIKFSGQPHPFYRQPKEKPLYLCVQGPTQSVDNAVTRINEIISNGLRPKGSRFSPIVRPPGNLPPGVRPPPINQPPPTMMSFQPQHQGLTFIQEKLFIELEHAPPTFDVKSKILGPGGCFLQHIQNETGAKVTLRGKGSNFIESATGREAFEPMHIHLQHANIVGLQQGRQLAENLIQTVQQDYAQFQQALAAMPASVSPGTATLLAGLQQQTSGNPNCGLGGMMGQQHGIPQLSVTQQHQYSQIPGPGMQAMTSLPPTFHQQVLPTSSVVLPANSLPASLTSMPPPTLVSQAQGLVSSANAGGLVIPVSYSTSLTPMPMVTTLSTSPLLSVGAGPPPPNGPTGQMDAGGGLLPNATLPPPMLQVSTAPGMSQYATTTNDPFLANTNLGGGQPTQVLVGQQALTQVGMSLAGANPQMAPHYGSHVHNSIAPPLNTLQPGVQFVSQQQMPQAGQPPPPPGYYGQFSGNPASMSMSLPAATYTVSPTTYAIATSGYAYNVGPPKDDAVQPPPPPPSQSQVPPQQPPKRRFTEEKPEDKVPENLLGYQHGPPHLANMITSGPPPPVVSSQHQSPVTQSFTQPMVTVTQTSQVFEDFRTQGFANPPPVNQPAFVTPPPPPPPSHSPSPERSEVDKHLMPPPAPPGSKRAGQHQGGPEPPEQRKKIKGALGSVAVYGSDDEEEDSSSPSRQQQQQRAAPYNQSGSTNPTYLHQGQPSPPPAANHYDQYLQGQVPTTSQQQQPPPLQHGQYSPPDPNSGPPYQSCSSPTNFAGKQSSSQQNHRNSYEQILSSQASQIGVPRSLSQSTFATTTSSLQTSQTYMQQPPPHHQQQQQPPPQQPHQFNGHTSAVATSQGYIQQFASQPLPSQQFSGQPNNQQPPPFQPPPPGMSFWMSPA